MIETGTKSGTKRDKAGQITLIIMETKGKTHICPKAQNHAGQNFKNSTARTRLTHSKDTIKSAFVPRDKMLGQSGTRISPYTPVPPLRSRGGRVWGISSFPVGTKSQRGTGVV